VSLISSSAMSAKQGQTKKLGSGERKILHHSEKASKYYPAEEDKKQKQARKTPRDSKLRGSLRPGTVVILLTGRFRGKRVVLLNNLGQGVLLVTGPFKINGVPVRRVNSRYVIATSTKVDLKDIDKETLKKVSDENYFAREARDKKKGEEAFFKQGEKQEKKEISSHRVEHQKSLDKSILATIRKTPLLESYLSSSFSLRKGERPHEMKF